MKNKKHYAVLILATFFVGMLSLTSCNKFDESSRAAPAVISDPSQPDDICGYCRGNQRCIYCQGTTFDYSGGYCLRCQATGKCSQCCKIPQGRLQICKFCQVGFCRVCDGLGTVDVGIRCHHCGGTGRCSECKNGWVIVR